MENTNKLSSGKGKASVVAEATRGLLYQSRCVSKEATKIIWEVYAKLRLKDLTDILKSVRYSKVLPCDSLLTPIKQKCL